MGSEAFGQDPEGRPTGALAFGEADDQFPLRGALVFGNDPDGEPRGAESIGEPTKDAPLRGALFFGNDPDGGPRGAESVGGEDTQFPLRGALVFGNDPEGDARGSEAFGFAQYPLEAVGAEAAGAKQLLPERITKDPIGYDLGGVLLRADDTTLAGMRKDPLDRIRHRVLSILERRCAVKRDDVRHGLNEHAIPWGRLRRDEDLDPDLAKLMRSWWRKAPGEVLGICHLWELFEESERMHTYELRSSGDQSPKSLSVFWDDELLARSLAMWHKDTQFYAFLDPAHRIWGYADRLTPRRRGQVSRVRDAAGATIALFTLVAPTVEVDVQEPGAMQFSGTMSDSEGRCLFRFEEKRSNEFFFRAELFEAETDRVVGVIEDRPKERNTETLIECDLYVSRGVVLATATILADLARYRRAGWPVVSLEEEEDVPSIEEALGPSRFSKV